MTPHATQNFLDGSSAIKIYPGGRWKVLRGADDGTDYYDCRACKFMAEQNRFIGEWHRESVTKVKKGGEAVTDIKALIDQSRTMTEGAPDVRPIQTLFLVHITDALEGTNAVVEAARRLEYEIDQCYDVDDGIPNFSAGAKWQDLRTALAALDAPKEGEG